MTTEATKTDDGGPAFPTQNTSPGYSGMSIRDYFAARAMAAILGTYTEVNRVEFARETGFKEADLDLGGFNDDMAMDCNGLEIAEWAYKVADAMIAQRKAVPQ